MHHETDALLWFIYVFSNAAIALGYGAMPVLVLPYLPLTRTVLAFGAAFFALCGLTHAGMAFDNNHLPLLTWFWAFEHLAQAVATWGFIITFHVLLRRATGRRKKVEPASAPGGDGSTDGDSP